MNQIEFKYNGMSLVIQCKENEKLKNICQHFCKKAQIDKNEIFFSYNGKAGSEFNEELAFNQMVNSTDKNENKMTILVNSIEEKDKYQPLSIKFVLSEKYFNSRIWKKYEISDENIDIGEFLTKIKINKYDRIIILIKNGNYFWNHYYETPESVYILLVGEHFDGGYYYYNQTKNNIKITVKIEQLTNPCNACSNNSHLSYTKLKILRDSTVEIIGIDFIECINPINSNLCPGGSAKSIFSLFGDNSRIYLCENHISFTCSPLINVLFFGVGKVFFHDTVFTKNQKCNKEKVFVVGSINGWNAGAKAFIYSRQISLDKSCLLFNENDKNQFIEYVNH